jgi:hypothetical protein
MSDFAEHTTTLTARERLRAHLRALQNPTDARRQAEALVGALDFLQHGSSRRLPRGERALLVGAAQRAAGVLTRELELNGRRPPLLPPQRVRGPAGGASFEAWFLEKYSAEGEPIEESWDTLDDHREIDEPHGSIDAAIESVLANLFCEITTPMIPSKVRAHVQ